MAIAIPMFLDKPITFWLGIILIFTLFATLATGASTKRGLINVKYHILAASITIIIAAVHATYGILTWI